MAYIFNITSEEVEGGTRRTYCLLFCWQRSCSSINTMQMDATFPGLLHRDQNTYMRVFTIVCSLRKPHTGGGVLSPRSATMPFLLHSFIPSWCRAGVNGKCFITFHHPVFDHLQDARMDGKAYEHLSYE